MTDLGAKPQEHNSSPDSESAVIASETQELAKYNRSQDMSRRLQNPEYHTLVLARLHSPEAIENSRLTRVKLYKENPDIFKRVIQTRKEHQLEQLKQLLGGDPKTILEDLYFNQGLLQQDIAIRFHKSKATIHAWFKMFGIATIRTRAVKAVKKQRVGQVKLLLGGDPKTILEDLYFKQGLTQEDIAIRLHKHPETIRDWFKKFGINAVRTRGGKTRREHYIEELRQLLGGDPKTILEDLYFKQGLSTTELATRFRTSQPTVSKWFKMFGIFAPRSIRIAKIKRAHYVEELRQLLGGDPKAVLEDLYINQGLSVNDIATRFHYKHHQTVSNWFKMFGISTIRTTRVVKTINKRQLERLEHLLGGDPKTVLEDLYFKQGLTQADIANRFNKSGAYISRLFKEFGITTIINRGSKTRRERYAEELRQLLGGNPKTILEDLYFKQGMSTTDIATRFRTSQTTVSKWFKLLGISAIPHGRHKKLGGSISGEVQEQVLSAVKNGSFEKLPRRQKELLTLRYLQTEKPLTYDQIAEKLCWISRQRAHELEKEALKRLQGHDTRNKTRGKGKKLKVPPQVKILRQMFERDPKQVLEELYIKQGLSMKDICDLLQKSSYSIHKSLKKHNITVRPRPSM